MVVQEAGIDAIGFVVAGGRSLRMGRDKALLPWRGSTLLDDAVGRLSEVCREVRILSGPAARYADRGLAVEVDAVPDGGPLAGVLAGLLRLAEAPGLFLAVDVPLVPVPLLRRILERAAAWDAVVPVTRDGPHPLCAAYTRACLEPVRRRVERGQLKMTGFWPEVRAYAMAEAELRSFGEPDEMLRNVNSPEDYERLTGA